jgi:uncharacterized protein YbaR (Trm112 family)
MIKYKKTLICKKCGKSFKIELTDAIYPWQQRLISYPICPRCRLKRRLSIGK